MASRDRLLDLMATRATEGLRAGESDELEQGLIERGERDSDDLDLAAAAVYLAFDAGRAPEGEAMPDSLKRRILASRRG